MLRLKLKHSFILWIMLLLGFFIFSSDAMALPDLHDPSGSLTGLLDLVKQQASRWDGKLRSYANTLFWLLATIQFIWTFTPLVFRQSDIGEIVGELIRFVMVIGFFYTLLLFSSDWADKVVSSFRLAGANAAGLGDTQIRPGDIFGTAIELANTIGDVDTLNPLVGMMIALAELVVLLCFTFIAAFMGLCIIESYIIINASVLFMGFGASQWTREYAQSTIRYAVSVGAKLFVLTLIVGIIVESAKTWQTAYNHDNASMWTMVGLALVCAYLAKAIPELIAGMISGTSVGGGAMIGGMAAAAVAGATAAIATLKAGTLTGATSSGVAGVTGEMGGSLASSINSSLAEGLSGASPTNANSLTSDMGVNTGGGEAAKGNTSSSQSAGTTQHPNSEVAKEGRSGEKVASGLIRGAGILAAISVPGMESSASLSLGMGLPQPMPSSANDKEVSMEPSNEPQNIIRPENTDN